MRSNQVSVPKKRKKNIPKTAWPVLTDKIKNKYHHIMEAEAHEPSHRYNCEEALRRHDLPENVTLRHGRKDQPR